VAFGQLVPGVLVFGENIAPQFGVSFHEFGNAFLVAVFFLFKVNNAERLSVFGSQRLVQPSSFRGRMKALVVSTMRAGVISSPIVN
jgi:hypothetical protein